MNRECLERLIRDRAAGALEPDVAELLEAFVAGRPEARELERLSAAATLARKALAQPSAIRVPAFPQAAIARRAGRSRTIRLARPIALAASLAAAFLIGRRQGGVEYGVTPRQVAVIAPVAGSTDIWAVSARRAAEPRPDRAGSPRIEWKSPLSWARKENVS